MASGVKCDDNCIHLYNEMKLRKSFRYLLFRIDEKGVITNCRSAERSATYEDMRSDLMQALADGDGRYAVFDYEYDGKPPALVFISWAPSELHVKKKMLYAASKDAIRKKLIGVKKNLEVNDIEELEETEFRKQLGYGDQ